MRHKLKLVLLILLIISFIIGLLLPSILSSSSKSLINDTINSYFISIKDNKLSFYISFYFRKDIFYYRIWNIIFIYNIIYSIIIFN